MKRSKKVALITAVVLILLGTTASLSTLAIGNFDFIKLALANGVTDNRTVDVEFVKIEVDCSSCDVKLIPSDNGKCNIAYCGDNKSVPVVTLENRVLSIKCQNELKWYEEIKLFSSNKLEISLPSNMKTELIIKTQSGSINVSDELTFSSSELSSSSGEICFSSKVDDHLSITTSSGNVKIADTSPNSIEILTSSGSVNGSALKANSSLKIQTKSGHISLNNAECAQASVECSSGDIHFSKVDIYNDIFLTSSNGDIRLTDCDAENLYIQSQSGSVYGNFLTPKIFITETSSGRVDVPKTDSGGICRVSTSSGNIKFTA